MPQCLPRQAFPAAPIPVGTDPAATGTDSPLQERPHCIGPAWRSPGERKKGHRWGARWGLLSQVTPPWDRETTLSPPEFPLAGRGCPLATSCPWRCCGLLPDWQRAGWCPGRDQGGRVWWPPSEATGDRRKEVEERRDEAECPCSPKDPLPLYAPSKLGIAPSTMKAGCSYGFPHRGTLVFGSRWAWEALGRGRWVADAPWAGHGAWQVPPG